MSDVAINTCGAELEDSGRPSAAFPYLTGRRMPQRDFNSMSYIEKVAISYSSDEGMHDGNHSVTRILHNSRTNIETTHQFTRLLQYHHSQDLSHGSNPSIIVIVGKNR
jgi:hypothetical protein